MATTATRNVIADLQSSLARCDGDRKLFSRMAEMFQEDSPALLRQIEFALLAKNSASIKNAAHSIRGQASIFDAPTVTELALKIELAATRKQLDGVHVLRIQLNQEVAQLVVALEQFIGK